MDFILLTHTTKKEKFRALSSYTSRNGITITMNKLLYLILAITFISCSKDDDNDPQTFFEKYDSVVWEEDYEDYINRIQFNNGTSVSVNY